VTVVPAPAIDLEGEEGADTGLQRRQVSRCDAILDQLRDCGVTVFDGGDAAAEVPLRHVPSCFV
jgi:hypothetical protein